MTNEQIRKLVMKIICWVDYDVSKFYDPETSEDPEAGEEEMQRLIKMVREELEAHGNIQG